MIFLFKTDVMIQETDSRCIFASTKNITMKTEKEILEKIKRYEEIKKELKDELNKNLFDEDINFNYCEVKVAIRTLKWILD